MFERTRKSAWPAGLIDYEFRIRQNRVRVGAQLAIGAERHLGLGPSRLLDIGGLRWRDVPDTREYVKRIAPPLPRQGKTVRCELREALERPATRTKSGSSRPADARSV